jgi:hypothetical protein
MILKRLNDGLTNRGSVVECIKWNEDSTFNSIIGEKPVVGCSIRIGNTTAKMFISQDWWLTTVVTEIIEEKYYKKKLEYCKFKTENSVYELYSEGYLQRNKKNNE